MSLFSQLEDNIRLAVMAILSTVYESSTVDNVCLGTLVRLFGVPEAEAADLDTTYIYFESEEFPKEYKDFISAQEDN